MIFTRSRQKVFDYIWDHPGCTVREIAKALHSKWVGSLAIEQHVYCIRKELAGTGYKLANSTTRRSAPATYSILPSTDTGPTNAPTKLATGLSGPT